VQFFFYCFCFAFANSPISDFKIPPQIGNVKEIFQANPSGPTAEKTIIQIQDAHCNYEAQKNLVQILEYLITERNLKLILVEGGSGDVSLSFLRGYADKKTREDVADKYLRMGKISGEEYLDIVSEHNIQLYGVEDEALYDANLDVFLQLEPQREQGLKDIEGLRQAVDSLIPYIYNADLKEFEGKRADYDQKTLTLAEYCSYLKAAADKKSLDLKEQPHLSAFVESARLEKELDFKQAEIERNIFIKELAKLLDENGVKGLISKTQEFKEQKITARDYYSYLKDKAQNKVDLERNYPQLNTYIYYIKVSKDINAIDLLKEVSVLEDKIREALFVNTDERQLSRISKALEVLSGFLKLDLTPEEYEIFNKDKSQYITGSWVNFLIDNCTKYNITTRPSVSQAIDENLEKLDEFYKLGIAREEAFISNLETKLNESGEKLVVLITGGFHTPGVTRMLKEKGYSYAVVAPVITQKSDPSIYFSVLRGEKSQSDEALNEEE
jgi:hypothetical protein